ncbi:hypothetical protein SLEP1_g2432 [Rubroshorea leprosula]|uniref:Uncharacterized protein n=1 Tax=Rubroshorea leprosula TaxID=152421 RepID=A0AAV5HRP8_9ROSI|nr:hypothetical protein SLEP1_g2432 [Rubroshorea leprosula]
MSMLPVVLHSAIVKSCECCFSFGALCLDAFSIWSGF